MAKEDVYTMVETPSTTFRSCEFASCVFQKLYQHKQANKFCDITLFVNNKVIKAHRNVLACSSPYFDSILKNHKIIREHIKISCFDSNTFVAILNFMYTGEITVNYSIVKELLNLANQFLLTKVVDYCIEFLETNLNILNCLFTYFLTHQFKLKHLGDIVENWIESRIDDVCNGEEILMLDVNQLKGFLQNKNFVLSTNKALNLLSHWVLRDTEKREKDFDQLIKCISTNDMEPLEVFQHLDTSHLYNKSELCLYRFLDYLLMNNWMLSNFKTRYDVLQVKYGQVQQDKCILNIKEDKSIITPRVDVESFRNKKPILLKARLRQRKKTLLKKLMLLDLQPNVRIAVLKMLTFKKKSVILSCDKEEKEYEDEEDDKISVKCPICFTTINDSLLLEQHLALSHAKNVTYKCGLCSFICQYHGDYINHMKTHFAGPPFKCDFCDYTAEQISKFISHRAQHLDESIYQCSVCSFKCRLKQNFICHMKMHTPDVFKCEHCSKSFRFGHNFDSHILNHSETKVSCDSCGFRTKFISHLIAHQRIHATDPYRCSYPHCKYTAVKKTQLLNHAKNHNGVRPHTCGVCGRGFMEKSHLVRHERIHLEEKPFKCSHCDYASSRRDKLKEHYSRHHGENASAKVPYKPRPLRNNGGGSKSRTQTNQDIPLTTINSVNNLSQSHSTTVAPTTQPVNTDVQELIMHHPSSSSTVSATDLTVLNSAASHHFAASDFSEFHHTHPSHAHTLHNQILGAANTTGTNYRSASHQPQHQNNNLVNHHLLSAAVRSNPNAATTTAAAVAAAMMLDPRFHHNTNVPGHHSTASIPSAADQTAQISSSNHQSDYSSSLPANMPLF